MRAVMYHYVRDSDARPPRGYYHLPVEQFRRQLDYLDEQFTLLSRSAFFDCLRGDRTPPEDGVVLTFDDGLLDHYDCVLPELQRRRLWGIFFVSTAPLVENRRLAVHRIHTLVSEYPGPELLDALRDTLDGSEFPEASGDDMYPDREVADEVRTFKRILNQDIPYDQLPGVLDALERQFPKAGDVGVEDLYITADQLADIADAGMVIGAHAISHRVLSRLSPERQRTEVVRSKRQLEEMSDTSVDLFAYPYGTEPTYTDHTVETVRDAGFDAAFTTVSGDITSEEMTERPFTLRRRDCAEIRHGDSSVDLPGGD